MGHTGIGAGNHNGIEGQTLGAVFIHPVDELRLQLQLGHTGLDNGQGLHKGLVGNLLGLAHQLDFPRLFYPPEAVDFGVAGQELCLQILFQVHKFRHGQVVFLIAQAGDAEVLNGLVDALGIIPGTQNILDLEALQILLGGLNVAAVRIVPAALFADHRHALGNVEFRAVVAAVAGGQQKSVYLSVQNGQEFFQVFHVFSLLFLARNRKGSSRAPRAFSQNV